MPLDSFVAPLAVFLAPTSPVAPAGTLTPTLASPPAAFALPPLAAPQFHAQGVMRTIVYAGARSMDSDFAPADDQTVFGIAIDVRQADGDASFETGYFFSSGDGDTRVGANSIDVESHTHELWMGARWRFDPWDGPFQPYVGTGLSLLRAEYKTDGLGGSDSNSAWAFGAYVHGGLEWNFAEGWSVGVDLRLLYSTPASLQADTALDYMQAALTLGWAW
ncbi:MAG: outer membrane beta-barrel protein [Planctomycetota bacterium]|nr:outer membrane beta-barrel protein [Planctomycetota bacterium]